MLPTPTLRKTRSAPLLLSSPQLQHLLEAEQWGIAEVPSAFQSIVDRLAARAQALAGGHSSRTASVSGGEGAPGLGWGRTGSWGGARRASGNGDGDGRGGGAWWVAGSRTRGARLILGFLCWAEV